MGERLLTKYTGDPKPPSRDDFGSPYHFYGTRGQLDGHDVDDWLAAEQELTHNYR
jgi:hypothetical protein